MWLYMSDLPLPSAPFQLHLITWRGTLSTPLTQLSLNTSVEWVWLLLRRRLMRRYHLDLECQILFYRWHALCQRWLVTVPALLTKLWMEECDLHSELIVCISLIKCHPYIVTALTPAPPDVPNVWRDWFPCTTSSVLSHSIMPAWCKSLRCYYPPIAFLEANILNYKKLLPGIKVMEYRN